MRFLVGIFQMTETLPPDQSARLNSPEQIHVPAMAGRAWAIGNLDGVE